MPLLKATAFDLSIAHPWVPPSRFRLNSFRHKGYWYHGKSRELRTMQLFDTLIRPNDTVAEVGGHIGFISMFFAKLVGDNGRVVVFEPGSNNLPYLRHNVHLLANVQVIEQAVSSVDGVASLHEESLTGQNNSLVPDFEGLARNASIAFVESQVRTRQVKTTRLDTFFSRECVDFIKIDIEGHEYRALEGAAGIIEKCHPVMMVEVQADRAPIFDMFTALGYQLFNDRLVSHRAPESLGGNVFCLPPERADQLRRVLGRDVSI
jgi:FkbM family methyltransferase